MIFTSIVAELSASSTTTVYVLPSTSIVAVGQTFIVEIKIYEVSDLYGWEFRLRWNPNLLDVVDVTEGNFLKQGGDTFFAKKANNTAGNILVDCTLLGNVPGVSGNGTLATVEFYAEVQGESILDLYETTLISSLEQPITHTANDGNVSTEPKAVGITDMLKPYVPIIVALIALAGIGSTSLWFFKFRKKEKREVVGAVPHVPTVTFEIEDDEEKVVTLLKSAGGRLYQSTIANQCRFSRSKTSKLLTSMESRGRIRREKRGREKVVTLIDEAEG
ncbi:MAG: cohesin domain-containing protein [Candidatus Bathyarchaeia archaeon]|nr:cohesin domain-containing protein [Candidatus Bathyarchaeia archaeon]